VGFTKQASLLSENSRIENARHVQHGSASITNLDSEMLVCRAFRDGLASRIDKHAERQIVRRFRVRQFDALFVTREEMGRPEVEKILGHETCAYFGACDPGKVIQSLRWEAVSA
jgi:hypothetical protein